MQRAELLVSKGAEYEVFTADVDAQSADVNEISVDVRQRGEVDDPHHFGFYLDAVSAALLAEELLKLAVKALPERSETDDND